MAGSLAVSETLRSNLTPDMDLASRLFDELRANSTDGLGVTRDAYGAGERMAHELARREAEALGLDVQADPVGNLYMTLPGTDRAAKKVLLGSHLDSVKEGGNFDGAAGVLAGLAAVAGLKRAGFRPSRDITVMATRAEEAGAWFPTSYPGSRGALGMLKAAELEVKRQDTGRSLADHMREEGFDPDFAVRGEKVVTPDNTAAFLEVHIEQGPVLDSEEIPVAVVTGIPGSRRLRQGRVLGEYNHSGGTPRRYRRDAAIALAELALGLDEEWALLEAHGHKLVCTFCTMATTEEAGFTKIAGEATFMLDVRSVNPASVDAIFARLAVLVPEIEARRGVKFDLGPETGSTASPMDAGVRAGLARAAEAIGVRHMEMASGGGHDAAAFAAAGIPAGMLFVRNQNGSHNPHEAMRMEDFSAACAVVTRWLADVAG
ncbi:hydantoinase/carbamoylase family amidase [Pseudoroseomonas wenyumeiae]|uniref:Hydantoinase/carbamoylase family amidase n=1 Tax=Teichococcus wenyumeiae TaxID=2478470 RepID=A0A3A9JE25_9PROT|nr:hydantoinase/carbamoylase family amidase [Pseudoroseomonas wenyumeiae]RMI19983.1 hydantoinase/carbamoylase family amidase [Pseudoroseomonas wenyumeiae]